MIKKLFEEYLELFSFRHVFMKRFRRWVMFLAVLLIIICEIILDVFLDFIGYSTTILFFLPLLIVLPVMKMEITHIIVKVFKCKNKDEFWAKQGEEFKKKLRAKCIDLNNKRQMEVLLERTRTELDDMKPVSIVQGGYFVAIIAPVWIAFTSRYFGFTVSTQDTINYFGTILMVIGVFYGGYLYFRKTIYDDIKHSKYRYLKEMLDFIEDLYLRSFNEKNLEIYK